MTALSRILLLVVVAGAPLGLQGQATPGGNPNDQTTPGVPRPVTTDSSLNQGGGTDAQAMKDKIFLRKAAQGGAAEVQLAQLALQKSSNESVKRFAQRMIDDHTAIAQSLKPFADELGVMTPKPTRMDQQEYERLAGFAGSDFDREYLAAMVKEHRKDLMDFTSEAETVTDPEMKEVVARDQMVIARHTRMAEKLAAATVAAAEKPAGNK